MDDPRARGGQARALREAARVQRGRGRAHGGGRGEDGRVLVEAFHYRYHPLAARMQEIVDAGELGASRHIEARHVHPAARCPGDIRYRLDLAGGALMDAGCYAMHLRALPRRRGARGRAAPRRASPRRASIAGCAPSSASPTAARARHCSLFSTALLRMRAPGCVGDRGEMRVLNPFAPQFYHRLTVRTPRAARVERVRGEPTYTHQLRAFVRAARGEAARPDRRPRDAVANMRVIDAVYRAAGLAPRGAHREAT